MQRRQVRWTTLHEARKTAGTFDHVGLQQLAPGPSANRREGLRPKEAVPLDVEHPLQAFPRCVLTREHGIVDQSHAQRVVDAVCDETIERRDVLQRVAHARLRTSRRTGLPEVWVPPLGDPPARPPARIAWGEIRKDPLPLAGQDVVKDVVERHDHPTSRLRVSHAAVSPAAPRSAAIPLRFKVLAASFFRSTSMTKTRSATTRSSAACASSFVAATSILASRALKPIVMSMRRRA